MLHGQYREQGLLTPRYYSAQHAENKTWVILELGSHLGSKYLQTSNLMYGNTMTKPELLMIGTNHLDEHGGEKIQASLARFRPEKVIVENSRASHDINLAAKASALAVLDSRRASDVMRELVLFERDGQLRDIDAVNAYARSTPNVVMDFFNDDEIQDVDRVKDIMRSQLERLLDQIARLPKASLNPVLQNQLAQMKRGFLKAQQFWRRDGDSANEGRFALAARMGDDPSKLIRRDNTMWDVLRASVCEGEVSKIATVTGAGHIVRTGSGHSLFELAENSGLFTIERDMVFAR